MKILGLGALALLGSAQAVAPASLPALGQLERGRWELRDLADAAAPRESMCLGDPATLVQLEHPGKACEREIVASEAKGGTIHYSCPGQGFGRTAIKVETPRLLKINTQGMAGGHPFGYRVEARRVGDC